jgi:hypothetical protein
MASKFGVSVHPTVNESNTHTDEELMSPEFRAGVELLKNMIRIVVVRSGIADKRLDNIATYWTAIHELAMELLLSNKGEEQVAMYESKLQEFSDWQMTQPVDGSNQGEKN